MPILNLLRTSRTAQLIAIVAALGLAALLLDRCAKRAMDTAKGAGRQEEKAAGSAEVIKKTEKANEAGQAVRRDGAPSRDDCLRDSRTPGNC